MSANYWSHEVILKSEIFHLQNSKLLPVEFLLCASISFNKFWIVLIKLWFWTIQGTTKKKNPAGLNIMGPFLPFSNDLNPLYAYNIYYMQMTYCANHLMTSCSDLIGRPIAACLPEGLAALPCSRPPTPYFCSSQKEAERFLNTQIDWKHVRSDLFQDGRPRFQNGNLSGPAALQSLFIRPAPEERN